MKETPVMDEKLRSVGWTEVVRRAELGPCWEWKGHCNKARGGYGQVHRHPQTFGAHRVAYRTWVGEIGDGLHVLHRCDNPPCVNPNHLFLGTNDDNMRDRDAKGRHVPSGVKGAAHPKAKLTEDDVQDIRRSLASGASMSELGRQYRVTPTSIYCIKVGRNWKHLPMPEGVVAS